MNILLLSSSDDLNLKVLYCLAPVAKNIHVIANKEKNKLRYSRYKNGFEVVPWSDSKGHQKANIDKIIDYCHKHKISVLVPGDVGASSFLFKYQQAFDGFRFTPIMSPEALNEIDNKWSFADRLMKAGISTPTTMYIENQDEASIPPETDIRDKIGFPLIVKPLFGESSHGVKLLADYSALKNHVESDEPYSQPPLIIQTYIEGDDIDASFVSDMGDIKSIAVQRWLNPDMLEYTSDEQVEVLAKEVVGLFSYCGPGHIDMRREASTGKVYVIEFNPRFWYTLALAMWQGLNFAETAVNYTLGRKYDQRGATGTIRLSMSIFKEIIKKPWTYHSYSESERSAMWQSLSDPLPFMLSRFDR